MALNQIAMKDFFVSFLQLFGHPQLHLRCSIDNQYPINNRAILDMQHLDITIQINI
jgi:hypothetical protein